MTTRPNLPKRELTGLSGEGARLQGNLLKLRGVLLLLSGHHGLKVTTARTVARELRSRGLKASLRSLYRWRSRYLRLGFAGLERLRRSDRGIPQAFSHEVFICLVDVAVRVKRYGDLAREFRRLNAGISERTFQFWVRCLQRELRVSEMSRKRA